MSAGSTLPAALTADDVRASYRNMRAWLHHLARERRQIWTGALPELAAALTEVARVDLCLARLVEGHADAIRILDQAGHEAQDAVYGVWASRSAGTGLRATRAADGRWSTQGTVRFASGVDLIDRALAVASVSSDTHVLLDLRADLASPDFASWRSPGMDASRSFTVDLDAVDAGTTQVGPDGFYLERPGFLVGGLAVAAVWVGGARQVVDLVTQGLRSFSPTPHQLRRVGAMEQAAWQAGVVLASVVRDVSREDFAGVSRARTAVVGACDDVLREAAVVVGPAGLSGNGRLARAVADLGVYVRQHHLDAELARLGGSVLDLPGSSRAGS